MKHDSVIDINPDFCTFSGSVVEATDDEKRTQKYYLFNKKLIHLIDDIFWQMGFHNSVKQETVVPIESLLTICIIGTI